MTREELGSLLVDRALLEGNFLLRSGKRSSFYLDKYRFETEPELLRELGARLGVRLRALFRAEELLEGRKTAAKRHG